VTVFLFMDRSFEDIRAEVLEMDRESQERLVEEIEQQWSDEIPDEVYEEAARRREAYRSGEATTISAEESIANLRKLIAEKKHAGK
jgi:hypothetical protein